MTKRWKAEITWISNDKDRLGVLEMQSHEIEEVDELQKIVEDGPDWTGLDIVIRLAHQRRDT